jgi:hypothetical protein
LLFPVQGRTQFTTKVCGSVSGGRMMHRLRPVFLASRLFSVPPPSRWNRNPRDGSSFHPPGTQKRLIPSCRVQRPVDALQLFGVSFCEPGYIDIMDLFSTWPSRPLGRPPARRCSSRLPGKEREGGQVARLRKRASLLFLTSHSIHSIAISSLYANPVPGQTYE